jgi:conjugative transfer signal peptidase TraF
MSRSVILGLGSAALLGVVAPAVAPPRPLLLWNASASVPIGLYVVRPAGDLRVGELVVVAPPAWLADLLDARRYLPRGVPMLKQVAALPGQTVCRTDSTITIDGAIQGQALDRDHLGRDLPAWQGCRVLRAGEVFLMNRDAAASFDGRYFGPLPVTMIIGQADPIWIVNGP